MFIESLQVFVLLYVWNGIVGGAVYVNILHNILKLETLNKSEKEIAISLCLMVNDIGILFASIASLLLDNFYFKIWDK